MGVLKEKEGVRRRPGAVEWSEALRHYLMRAADIDEDTAAAAGVHLADLREAAGHLYRWIRRLVNEPPSDPEKLFDTLIELGIEAEHARYHINELLPVLEAVIDALPVEDDEEE